MNPNQLTLLNLLLTNIATQLHATLIPPLPSESDLNDANLAISAARRHIQLIDHQLFNCYRVLDKFADENHPPQSRPRPAAFTVDDI